MKNAVKKNLPFIISLLVFIFIYYIYIVEVSYDVPFMDYWRASLKTIKLMENGNSLLSIVTTTDFGQRNPLLYFCLYINIKFFHLNCRISEYAAVVSLIISSVLVYKRWIRGIKAADNAINIKTGLFAFVLVCFFNLNQWEILHIQFAFPFMTRIAVYILIFYLIDQALLNESGKLDIKRYILSGVVAAFAVFSLSQLYYPAMLMACVCIFFLHDYLNRKSGQAIKLKYIALWCALSLAGVICYFWGMETGAVGGSGIGSFVGTLFDGQLISGILGMLVSIILPQSWTLQMEDFYIYVLGGMIFIIWGYAVFLYFKTKMYRQSYMPLLMIIYGGVNMGAIAYGRLEEYGFRYLMSSRYVVETTLILGGILYIYSMALCQSDMRKCVRRVIALSSICLMAALAASYCSEFNRAKYVYEYKESLGQKLWNINTVKDEELAGLQADPAFIRELTPILRKNKYSLFGDYDMETTIQYLHGISSEDSWVEEQGAMRVNTGSEGRIVLTGYNPNAESMKSNNCSVYLNGEKYGDFMLEEYFEYSMEAGSNQLVELRFETLNPVQAPDPDIRQLAFQIIKVEAY